MASGESDYDDAFAILEHIHECDVDELPDGALIPYTGQAVEIVKARLDAVKRVARALRERGSLYGHEVVALIEEDD